MKQNIFKKNKLLILFFCFSLLVNYNAFSQVVVDFEISVDDADVGQSVSFTNRTTGASSLATYSWDFGDGANIPTSSFPNPGSVMYATGDEKTITLKVCDKSICTSIEKTLVVYSIGDGKYSLQVDFSTSNKTPKINEEISLTSDVTGGKGRLYYQWDAGEDGVLSNANGENPTVKYSTEGIKKVTLTIKDDNGEVVETKSNFILVQSGGFDLTADFNGCGVYNLTGATITFSNNSIGGEGAPYTCEWDFGDGSTATGEYIYHRFTEAGTYDVVMTISDGITTREVTKEGCITMREFGTSELQPGFSINDNPITNNTVIIVGVNQPVVISDNSQYREGDNVEYIWQFAALPWQKPDVVPSQSSEPGPHVVYFKYPNETIDISLRLIDHSITLENNKVAYRAGAIKTQSLGATGCKASLGDITLSTNCWVKGGPYPKLNVEVTHNEFEPSIRIYSGALGKYIQDGIYKKDGIIDFGGNPPPFPLIDTWRVEACQYDGASFTVLDTKYITVDLYGSNPNAGKDGYLCKGLTYSLGSPPETGVTYQWTSSSSSGGGMPYLSSTNTSQTTFTAQANGIFKYTLVATDAHGCVSGSNVAMTVQEVTVTGKNYLVSKGEPVTFDLAPAVGGVGHDGGYFYSWTPATNLSSTIPNTNAATILNPTFTKSTGGINPLILTITDGYNNKCTGTTTVNVEVSKTAPSGLVANTYKEGDISLRWQINTKDETGFVIERASDVNFTSLLKTINVGPGINQYIDQGLTMGDIWYYRVSARKGTTNLGYSNKVMVTVTPPGMTFMNIGQIFRPTLDGGFIGASLTSVMQGSQYTNTYTVQKTNSCGAPTWTSTYTTKSDYDKDVLADLLVTSDGGYLLTAMSRANIIAGTDKSENSRGGKDFWLLKIPANGGTKTWDKTLGGGGYDSPLKLAESPTGYLVIGNSISNAGFEKSQNNTRNMIGPDWQANLNEPYYADVWIVKVNTNGVKAWDRTLGNGNGIASGGETLLRFRQDGESSQILIRSSYRNSISQGYAYLTPSWFLEINNGTFVKNQILTPPNTGIYYADFLVMNVNGVKKMALMRGNDFPDDFNNPYYNRRLTMLDYNNLGAVATFTTYQSLQNNNGGSPFGFLTSKSGSNAILFTFYISNSGKSTDKSSTRTGYWLLGTDVLSGAILFERTLAGIPGLDSYQQEADLSYTFFYNGQVIYNTGGKTYPPALVTNTVNPLVYYPGDVMQVSATLRGCPAVPGNNFIFQLSNGDGAFDAPTVLATVPLGATSASASVNIPPTTAPGISYLVRTLTSNPALTGIDNGQYITIKAQEIITGTISPLEYTPGNTINVPFTTKGAFPQGNVFSVQISDASGSFASAKPMTTTASTASMITATIPSATTFGGKYRVRVVASSPATIGNPNTEDIRIGELITNQPSLATYYGGDLLTVGFIAKAAFNTDNKFVLQLSDETGSFTNATTLGMISGTASSSISATIPIGTKSSNRYKVRVISTSPAKTGIENGTSFSIWDLAVVTNNIASTQLLCGDAIKVPYTVFGGFNIGNTFTVQLSDANGFFTSPVTISNVPVSATTGSGTIDATIPPNTKPGLGYRVRVIGNAPVRIGVDNGQNISIGVIQVLDINPKSYYPGKPITIPFTTKYSFPGNNTFVAELSDADGNFDNATMLGYRSSAVKNYLGNIFGTIPSYVKPGTGYKIRVYSSSPQYYSPPTVYSITITLPDISFTLPQYIVSCGSASSFDIPFTVSGQFSNENVFTAQLSDPTGVFDDHTLQEIGYATGTGSGVIHAIIPAKIKLGVKGTYNIRIVASSPSVSATGPNKVSFLTSPLIGNVTVCEGSNLVLSPQGVLPNGTYNWYSYDIVNQAQFIGSGLTYNLNNVKAGTYEYLVSYEGIVATNTCLGNPTHITVTVRPIPVAPAVTKGMECPSGQIATSLKLANPLPAGYRALWYDSPTGSNLLYTGTEYRPTINQTTTYYVALSELTSGCESQVRTPGKMVYFPNNFLVVSNTVVRPNEHVEFTVLPELYSSTDYYYNYGYKGLPFTLPITSSGTYIVQGGPCSLTNSVDIKVLSGVTSNNNMGLQFNKTAEYCAIPDNQKLRLGTSDFTLEATIKASSIQNNYPVILSNRSTAAAGYDGFLFALYDNGRLFVQVNGSNFPQVGGIDLRDNQCHNVAVTRTGTILKFYVDGVLNYTTTHPAAATSISPDIASDMWIGSDKVVSGTTSFNGVIDNVRIWTKALDDATILKNTNQKVYAVQPNLVADWTFDEEASDKNVYDHTSNSLNGSLYSGTAALPIRVVANQCYVDNWALKFGGNTASIGVENANANSKIRTGEFTLEANIRANANLRGITPIMSFLDNNRTTSQALIWAIDWSKKEMVAIINNTNLSPAMTKTSYMDNQCHHIAITRTNDGTYTTITFYLDGVAIGSEKAYTSTGSNYLSYDIFGNDIYYPTKIRVAGVNASSAYRNFMGYMDNVRIWNVARTPAQIQTGMSKTLSTATGLVMNWTFDDPTATMNVADQTGYNTGRYYNYALADDYILANNLCGSPIKKGVEEEEVAIESSALNVYPNPFRDLLHVVIPGKDPSNGELMIIDMRGAVVYKTTIAASENAIDIKPSLSSGIYQLVIKKGTIFLNNKITKVE